jgi:PA14 domain/Bacterial Ig domain/Secretion system C-terminal sorting domain/Galactose oxidase, central domain
MLYRHLLLISLLLSFGLINGQSNQWTWMKGSNQENQPGVYNDQGVGNLLSTPGSRINSVSWSDNKNNFLWLFGGQGYSSAISLYGHLNDLWRYDITTNTWIWVKGSNLVNQAGIYGNLGVIDVANNPGAREGAVRWTDSSGNLWLFGGYGFASTGQGYLNDLWRFDHATNSWAWMKGASLVNHEGEYGTPGVSDSAYVPSARYGAVSWVDTAGNLWLFGGYGLHANQQGYLNDLWKFEVRMNQWTFVRGGLLPNQTSIYGIKGIASADNAPGGRVYATGWVDRQNGIWLFGGEGYSENISGRLGDLWKYDLLNNTWTWINGTKVTNPAPSYGAVGITNITNDPGERVNSVTWVDSLGFFWLFGGYGYSNDLWKYDISSNNWTWVKGSDQQGKPVVYGIKGAANHANDPGGRLLSIGTGSADKLNKIWLFGGLSPQGLRNDLWSFNISKTPSVYISSPSNNRLFTAGTVISLNAIAVDVDGNISKVEFYNNGFKFLTDSTAPYGLSSNEAAPGNYVLTAKAFDNSGDSAFSDTVRITVIGCVSGGSITGEGYTNITGTQVADLIATPNYPNNPSVTVPLGSFEYSGVGDSYGARLRGYICAPQTGAYTFYIAGDDQAGLWLSTDENPANKILIAYNISPVGFRDWTATATQKSVPIQLIQGVRYYIETLHKQNIGTNHLSVAWVLPDGTPEGPIAGNRLSTVGSAFTTTSKFDRTKSFGAAMQEFINNSALKVVVAPNPTSRYFTLVIKSGSNKTLNVTVSDAEGRLVEAKRNLAPNNTIQIGDKLIAGVYFVEVMQDGKKQRLKLVKQ